MTPLNMTTAPTPLTPAERVGDQLVRRPITLRAARRFIAAHHRHSAPPAGWLFGLALEQNGEVVAVGVAARPVARRLDDGRSIEITRVCTLGHRNAASMLYGALCRAAAALGYQRAYTYTLAAEPAASVRAAGFAYDSTTRADRNSRPGRPRYDADLFGTPRRAPGAKHRWRRDLAPGAGA